MYLTDNLKSDLRINDHELSKIGISISKEFENPNCEMRRLFVCQMGISESQEKEHGIKSIKCIIDEEKQSKKMHIAGARSTFTTREKTFERDEIPFRPKEAYDRMDTMPGQCQTCLEKLESIKQSPTWYPFMWEDVGGSGRRREYQNVFEIMRHKHEHIEELKKMIPLNEVAYFTVPAEQHLFSMFCARHQKITVELAAELIRIDQYAITETPNKHLLAKALDLLEERHKIIKSHFKALGEEQQWVEKYKTQTWAHRSLIYKLEDQLLPKRIPNPDTYVKDKAIDEFFHHMEVHYDFFRVAERGISLFETFCGIPTGMYKADVGDVFQRTVAIESFRKRYQSEQFCYQEKSSYNK